MAFSVATFGQQPATSTAPKPVTPTTPSSSAAEPAIKPPANPITPAQIKEMQELTGAEATKKRIVANAMQFYRSQFPSYVPQDVIDDLDKSLENADLESHAAEIYPKYISTEDATKIIEFYKSPAGQRMIEAQPYMMTEMQRSAVQVAQQTAKDVMARHKEEIEAAQRKYMDQQQQQKPSLSAPPSPSSNPQGTSKPQGTTNPPSTPQK
jgi:alpha-galactosidase/6-phospho-beta-glucosidase family protein